MRNEIIKNFANEMGYEYYDGIAVYDTVSGIDFVAEITAEKLDEIAATNVNDFGNIELDWYPF